MFVKQLPSPPQGDYYMCFDGGDEKIFNFLITTIKTHVKGDFSSMRKIENFLITTIKHLMKNSRDVATQSDIFMRF